ncbi:uncharacterized protein CPUR_01522 [Claviceps purpurea 20.1]|uniref:TAM domain methyltransferase n=1 Tax=Claviceps purpurea (strain 20.1) TaxID=1111077 RepID=M1W6V2_CLAP2|nr:uncharacterized protein CPUR_01522 [Claviceps purpurea 20.1]
MSAASQANEPSQPDTEDVLIAADEVPTAGPNDNDSVFSDSKSSTASISSSILEYRRINGRTYHSDKFAANYFLPNDDQQLESVELTHHYMAILFDDRLFLAPLEKEKIHRVLDVGTGTGIWAIEFADQFPNASVIGTDLSPCQPQWIPPNVRFEIDDAGLEWTWNADYFDFIHIRLILGGIEDWTALLKEAYRCCAPGGWVESVEGEVDFRSDDGTTELQPVLASVAELYREAGKILKRPFVLEEIQPQAFDEAGFVEKRIVRYKVPVGPWAKDPKLAEVGRCFGAAVENDLQGYTQMLWQSLQRPADEYHVWLAALRKAIRNPKVHSYMIEHVVYGRKPQ